MTTYTPEQLKKILTAHQAYLRGEPSGIRANLTGADLSGADLRGADLSYADLRGANLRSANLTGADLSYADLRGADLRGADLSYADLRGANLSEAYLSYADLTGADLRDADLRSANLTGANLRSANLRDADLTEDQIARLQIVPSGAFEAFKKVRDGVILRLLIPAKAKRWGGLVGRKCRASEAKVLGVVGSKSRKSVFASKHDASFKYRVGATVKVKHFCDDPRIECAAGIHFFITEIEAREY